METSRFKQIDAAVRQIVVAPKKYMDCELRLTAADVLEIHHVGPWAQDLSVRPTEFRGVRIAAEDVEASHIANVATGQVFPI